MRARYQSACYDPPVRTLALVLVVAAACGKSSGDTKPKEPARTEQTDVIAREGKPLTLLGPTLDVGDSMPDVAVYDAKLDAIKLGSLKGKVVVLSVVPSIDTRVCESQTHHMSNLMEQLGPDVEVMTVSRDLPFAQQRFQEEAMTKTKFGSDYKEREFGRAFGVDVKETGLLARSVWVVGKDGKIAYRQLVANQSSEPDYDALLAAVKRL
jgi:thioredoxin-dependent peroxiredoxin